MNSTIEPPDYITDARFIDSEQVPSKYIANRSLEECTVSSTARARLQEMGDIFGVVHVKDTMLNGDVYRTKDMEGSVFVRTYDGIAFYVYTNYEVSRITTVWAHVFDEPTADENYSAAELHPIHEMNIEKAIQNKWRNYD